MAKSVGSRRITTAGFIFLFLLPIVRWTSIAAEASSAPLFESTGGSFEPFTVGAKLFSDRDYTALTVPPVLEGTRFMCAPIADSRTLVCSRPVTLYAVTPLEKNSLSSELLRKGFERLPGQPVLLFGTNPDDRGYIYRKTLQADETLQVRKWVLLFAHGDFVPDPAAESRRTGTREEKLYNGIVLSGSWPPRSGDPAADGPMALPYLDHPPAVIPIDIGRQLFVDDFLIETTDLSRTFHTAEKYEGNPVFKPETPVELAQAVCYLGHGGVFYDSEDKLFKMWYSAGDLDGALAYATSREGFVWDRPDMGLPAGGNLLLSRGGRTRGSHAGGDNCVWLDTETTNRSERIKFMTERDNKTDPHWLMVSPDGRSWSEPVGAGRAEDYCSFFFNPFRNMWVYSIKRNGSRGRCRYYAESPDFLAQGIFDSSVYWCNADRLDEPDPNEQCPPQLYSLTAVAYESLMLGVFYVHLGPPNDICSQEKRPKITELKLGFSRDGFHWERPDRRAFIPASRKEGTWDRGYVHSNSGVCLVDGDRLIFPYCAFSGTTPDGRRGIYCGASVGYAMLRRDGFASMDAGVTPGGLTTRPLAFSGKCLFVNVNAPDGFLRAEILDESGTPIEPFTIDNCNPLTADSTITQVTWTGASDLSALAGRPVRLRFELTDGSLYSFWISRDETGRSDGYVAAGGPGYPEIKDTVGKAALTATGKADQ
jgi:hypothetical protein